MKNYYPFRTIVAYKDKKKADKWRDDFIESYSLTIKSILNEKDRCKIILLDDSIIDIIPAMESARGHRADRVYIDKDVDQFLKDNVFEPMRISQPLIEF